MRLRRGGDAAWALLLLGLGHLALGHRLGWSLFDLFCLDAWLLPAWFTLRERKRPVKELGGAAVTLRRGGAGGVRPLFHEQRLSARPAQPARVPPRSLSRKLQHRLALLLKALLTQPMRGFGWLHAWLQGVGEHSTIHVIQRVAFLLCRPVFGLHQLFFQLTHAICQRELVRLGRECARIGGHDLSVQFSNLGVERLNELARDLRRGRGSVAEVEHALEEVRCKLEVRTQRQDCADIGHGGDSTSTASQRELGHGNLVRPRAQKVVPSP